MSSQLFFLPFLASLTEARLTEKLSVKGRPKKSLTREEESGGWILEVLWKEGGEKERMRVGELREARRC